MCLTRVGFLRVAWLIPFAAFGQTPATEAFDPARPSFSPPFNTPALTIRPDADVGTLEPVVRLPPPDTFTLFTSQTYYRIDNLFLSAPNRVRASAWEGDIGVSYVPYATYYWTPRLTFEQTLNRFHNASLLDNNGQTVTLDNRLGLTSDNLLAWNLRVSYRRLEGDRHGLGEFYRRADVHNNLNWFIPLDRANRYVLHLSPGILWRSAHPQSDDLVNGGVLASFIWFASSTVAFEPFAELSYTYYPNDSANLINRRDWTVRSGLNAAWRPTRHTSLSLSAYWLGNYSSTRAADYEILPWVTLSAAIGF